MATNEAGNNDCMYAPKVEHNYIPVDMPIWALGGAQPVSRCRWSQAHVSGILSIKAALAASVPFRFRRPVSALFADPPPTHGACCTLQVELSSVVTTGVYWLDTESPMIRQFGRSVETSWPGPGDQHSVEFG